MLAMVLLSHAGDDAAVATWSRRDIDVESCWQWFYRAMPTMVLLR
jgi:hypothetical protein